MSSPRQLRIVGDFAEWTEGRWGDRSSITGAIDGGPGQPTQRRLAFYLLQGTPLAAVVERRPDVLDGEHVYLSASWLSDGDWVWRRDLAHYVDKYNLALPEEFIEHASSFLWSPGVLMGEELSRCVEQLQRLLREDSA
jgi:hypothetical protein